MPQPSITKSILKITDLKVHSNTIRPKELINGNCNAVLTKRRLHFMYYYTGSRHIKSLQITIINAGYAQYCLKKDPITRVMGQYFQTNVLQYTTYTVNAHMPPFQCSIYRQIFNIRRTKSLNLNHSCLVSSISGTKSPSLNVSRLV